MPGKKTNKIPASFALYSAQPIHSMNDREAQAFAQRQARRAAETIAMSDDERGLYASAVYQAVRFFNSRDAEHHDMMRYREELRLMMESGN